MKKIIMLLLVMVMLSGCGNVYLHGEAMTAAELSTLDAYQATQRVELEPDAAAWIKSYLEENFRQWRYFVRAAKKDLEWGPKLGGE